MYISNTIYTDIFHDYLAVRYCLRKDSEQYTYLSVLEAYFSESLNRAFHRVRVQ